ncbi:Aldo/keto reductase [Exidia glandulosa HHB12029]|uniref:Aldo/keto reductase n=1 Tax=Exidia glandulosa HHB12029 TaxID=1314781 RepID=A0A165GVB1_EXIGL|nr:Aldo/keto reductase [Exidia glandulosa HHB12029]
MPARVPLIFGTMTIGEAGRNGVRNSSLEEAQQILDVFFSHGYRELDTARMYAEGTTEQYLPKLDLKGSSIDTKVYPVKPGDHAPENLRSTFETSLGYLVPHAVPKVRVFYLHAPDRSVPFADTLREADRLYKEGKFEQLGLSNYAAWEVAEIVGICERDGFVKPTIYQAMYNALTRAIEPELVPCLRKFGLRLVVYNPLAGGLLAGKVAKGGDLPEGRFGGESGMAKMYRARYLQDGYFSALEDIKAVATKHGLTTIEIALRWCQHHSALTPTDGVILGASSASQLEQNCADSEKGPLPADVLDVLDAAWLKVAGTGPTYWR